MYDEYQMRTKNLIKWYEYQIPNQQEQEATNNMQQPVANFEMPVNSEMPVASAPVSLEPAPSEFAPAAASDSPVINEEPKETVNHFSDEEIDISTVGLNLEEMDLYESIMAKFQDAKQDSVDNVFATANQPSEDELVASICTPKQNNVDDLIKQAKGE